MTKNAKRPFAALLLALFALVLAACGSTGTGTTGGNQTSSTPATGEATTGATTAATTGAMAETATTGGATMAETPTGATMAETATTGGAMMAETPTGGAMMAETATTGTTGATGGNLSGKLTLAGSSALLPLMQEAANQFQAANSNVQITVTAGGSGAGRTQVCQGKIDIGNSDVKLSDDEKTKLSCADAQEVAVAIQAFAPVANKQGPGSATNLTKDQLVSIFTGQVTNWKDVGGSDQEIVLINRAKGSGTRSQMGKFLFGGDDTKFAAGASEEDNSETVRQTVAQTPGAISYLALAYANDPSLLAFNVDGVAANTDDIKAGKWPIGGPGYSITKGAPSDIEKAFLDFVTGDFQKDPAFAKLGLVPVK